MEIPDSQNFKFRLRTSPPSQIPKFHAPHSHRDLSAVRVTISSEFKEKFGIPRKTPFGIGVGAEVRVPVSDCVP